MSASPRNSYKSSNDFRYAHKLDIPEVIFQCAAVKEIERIGVDLVVL